MSKPTSVAEYAFSGSLCRVRKFQTVDGMRYCLTVFSLSDYKQLHFPHEEYKWLISKLYAFISTQAILKTVNNSDVQKLSESVLTVNQIPFDDDFKIKFGNKHLTIGPVTAFGLVNTTPFTDIDVFSTNNNNFTCDSKWDICTCKTCPVFKRLIDFEATALIKFSQCKPVNAILFHH